MEPMEALQQLSQDFLSIEESLRELEAQSSFTEEETEQFDDVIADLQYFIVRLTQLKGKHKQ